MGVPYSLQLPIPFASTTTNAIQDNPYEIDLVSLRADDSAFGEEDLEELLRHNDMDMQLASDVNPSFPPFELPTTLSRILATPIDPPNRIFETFAHQLTTRSFDIPTLNAAVPDADEREELAASTLQNMLASGRPPTSMKSTDLASVSLVELATKRLLDSDPNRTDLEVQLRAILPPEVREGRRMDLNRLFGNGIDDNNNGVVDEPIEWAANQRVWEGSRFEADGHFGDHPFFTRQQFARHLFCLAMLAMDEGFDIQKATTGNPPTGLRARQVTARRFAQWAINVVDFRDPDSAMTPFEYDWDPFDDDGWSVDDRFTTDKQVEVDRQIVWGCELPDLLITETLAFHDRRVRDTDMEAADSPDDENDDGVVEFRFPQENNDDDPMNNVPIMDATLDQYRIPQGSLFIELYATGPPALTTHCRSGTSTTQHRDWTCTTRTADSTWTASLSIATAAVPFGESRSHACRTIQHYKETRTIRPDLDLTSWQDGEQAVLTPALLDEKTIDLTIDAMPESFRTLVNSDAMLVGANSTGTPEAQVDYDRFILFARDNPAYTIPRTATYYYNHNANANVVGDPFSAQVSVAPGEYCHPRAPSRHGRGFKTPVGSEQH